jgi:hypothetical protein
VNNPEALICKIRYAVVASIALTCLIGCTQVLQAPIEATASVAQELSLVPSSTPANKPPRTATLMSTETPTPESTPTPTPIGLLLELHLENGQEIAWSPDSERIALLSRRGMELYNSSDLTLISKSELGWIPSNINFSHDGLSNFQHVRLNFLNRVFSSSMKSRESVIGICLAKVIKDSILGFLSGKLKLDPHLILNSICAVLMPIT